MLRCRDTCCLSDPETIIRELSEWTFGRVQVFRSISGSARRLWPASRRPTIVVDGIEGDLVKDPEKTIPEEGTTKRTR
jgi:hypothetical protein